MHELNFVFSITNFVCELASAARDQPRGSFSFRVITNLCAKCVFFLCVRAKPPKAYRAAREELLLVAIAQLFWNHSVDIPRNTAVTAASRFCAMNI